MKNKLATVSCLIYSRTVIRLLYIHVPRGLINILISWVFRVSQTENWWETGRAGPCSYSSIEYKVSAHERGLDSSWNGLKRKVSASRRYDCGGRNDLLFIFNSLLFPLSGASNGLHPLQTNVAWPEAGGKYAKQESFQLPFLEMFQLARRNTKKFKERKNMHLEISKKRQILTHIRFRCKLRIVNITGANNSLRIRLEKETITIECVRNTCPELKQNTNAPINAKDTT